MSDSTGTIPDTPTDAQNLNRLPCERSASRLIAEAERRFHSTRDRFYNDVAGHMRNAEGFRAREQSQ